MNIDELNDCKIYFIKINTRSPFNKNSKVNDDTETIQNNIVNMTEVKLNIP